MTARPEACDTWRGALALEALGRLPEAERMALSAHTDGCEACRRELADLSATGAAGGVEREAMSMAKQSAKPAAVAFVACASPEVSAEASGLLARLREAGIPADSSPRGRSLGKQFEDAGSMGARWVLVLGKREVSAGAVTLRDMGSGKEEMVSPEVAIRRIGAS